MALDVVPDERTVRNEESAPDGRFPARFGVLLTRPQHWQEQQGQEQMHTRKSAGHAPKVPLILEHAEPEGH